MENRKFITFAKALSGIFTPFIIPFVGFLFLFLFTYMKIMPFQYKLVILGIVYFFTIMMPILFIYLFNRLNGGSRKEDPVSGTKGKIIPYVFTLIAYAFCLGLMYRLEIPTYMSGIIFAALVALAITFAISFVWNISAHMVGMGGVIGSLIAFGYLFFFNPVLWLCIFIIIAGMVGTSRMMLEGHGILQIIAGFVVGFGSAIIGILY